MRRALILDAAEALMAEHDPLTVTLEKVAEAAHTSRPLIHTYFGDRRGLIDALQVRLVRRLAEWVDHGLNRAGSAEDALEAVVTATFSFVDQQRDAWTLLVASGGLDHPDLHAVRSRWVQTISSHEIRPGGEAGSSAASHTDASSGDDQVIGAQAAVAALLLGAGGWVARGHDPRTVTIRLSRLLG